MSDLTLKRLAILVLKETKTPMTFEEIWDYAVNKSSLDTSKFQGKTPWKTIGAYIYKDLKEKESESDFVKISGRPTKFFLNKNLYPVIEENASLPPVIMQASMELKEKDLHKYLTYFADLQFNAYTKTIDDKKSIKASKGSNEWLHPDIVGVYSPRDDWEANVLDLNSITGNTSVKIYSFELKRELNLSNLRESFFQTVSNSYWANESYLVAGKVSNNTDFIEEIKRLSSSFGIGIIELNVEQPENSEVIFPASYREQLDWETINKLCTVNTDFKDLLIQLYLC